MRGLWRAVPGSAPVPGPHCLGLGQPDQRVRRGRGLAAHQRQLGEGPVEVRGQRVEPRVQRPAGQFRPGGKQVVGCLPGLAELTTGHRNQPPGGVAEPERHLVAEPVGLRRLPGEQVEHGPGVPEHESRLAKGRIYFRSQRSGEISAECLPISGKLLPGRKQVGKLPVNESTSLWGADDSAGRT